MGMSARKLRAMNEALPEELTDAVYRAALEPAAWHDVMQLMQQRFPSAAQTFYLLHMQPRRVQPVSLAGIAPKWVRSFDSLYFLPDNPWMRLTQRLHRPGVVRSNERLDRLLGERGALYRCAYYNDWMRPQGLRYTMGSTLLAEGGVVANITLMRAPDMKSFDAGELRAFEALNRHMTRALQLGLRLEQPSSSPAGTALLDALPQPAAIVDAQRRVLHANAAMERLLQRGRALRLRNGELHAGDAASNAVLHARIAGALAGAGDAPLRLRGDEGHAPLELQVVPLTGRLGRALVPRPTVLLLAADAAAREPAARAAALRRHGCTPTEARLAELLAGGLALRECAQRMGVTYGSARVYLKAVFDKLGVHSQAQLVARLLGGERES